MSRFLILVSLFFLLDLPLFAKSMASGNYIELKFSEKLHHNRIRSNSSVPVHVSKEANLDNGLKFHFGNSGFAKIEYESGNFLTRQTTLFWGNPVIKIFEATVYDNEGQPHVCRFSKKRNKVKRFRAHQHVHVVSISNSLTDAVIRNTLDTAATLESNNSAIGTDKTFYCHF